MNIGLSINTVNRSFNYAGRMGKKLIHRLDLKCSYRLNWAALLRKIDKAGVHSKKRSIIVISQVVHFGDIVACEPMVRQVRSQNPEAFIVFALRRNYRELVDKHPDIDHVLALACVTEWAWFACLSLFDQIVDMNIYGRACERCGMSWYNPAGSHGVTVENYYKMSNLLEAYCRSAGYIAPKDGPKISPSDDEVNFVNGLNLAQRFVTLHASSNESDRQLPITVWRDITDYINKRWRLPVVEIGLKPAVLSPDDTTNRSLCGQLTILQSAEVIRRSLLYLGTDSGPAHLANAVGAYGIIVLGHYRNFQRYMPYSGDYANGIRSELLYHNGPVAEMPVAKIIQAIDRRLQLCSLLIEGVSNDGSH